MEPSFEAQRVGTAIALWELSEAIVSEHTDEQRNYT